jgi:hypothetical protein
MRHAGGAGLAPHFKGEPRHGGCTRVSAFPTVVSMDMVDCCSRKLTTIYTGIPFPGVTGGAGG